MLLLLQQLILQIDSCIFQKETNLLRKTLNCFKQMGAQRNCCCRCQRKCCPSRSPFIANKQLAQRISTMVQPKQKECQPIVLAAVVHNQFEVIHPFQDGNGGVGRLLLNNILLRHNLSLTSN
jgi:hypothetical protein